MAYGFNSDKSKVDVLPLTSGTLSNSLKISSNADVGYNKVPASEVTRSFMITDKDGNAFASFIGAQRDTTGRHDCQLVAWGRNSSNANVWNSIVVGCTKEGNPYYSLTSPKDFRDALGATNGVWPTSQIPDLDAAKIASGTLATARIPNLAASKITSGALALARGGTGADNSSVAINRVFAGPSSGSAGNASWRALVSADIPALAASKISSGTFDEARIPGLAASKITSGTFAAARIPDLAASKITSGTLALARGGIGVSGTSVAINKVFAGPSSGSSGNATFRSLVANDIPNISAAKITSGTLPVSQGGTGSTAVATASGVVTSAQSGITLGGSVYTQWGKVATLLVEITNTVSRSAAFKACTVVSGKRPKNVCYGFNSGNAASVGITTDGSINLSKDFPVGVKIVCYFVYLLA